MRLGLLELMLRDRMICVLPDMLLLKTLRWPHLRHSNQSELTFSRFFITIRNKAILKSATTLNSEG